LCNVTTLPPISSNERHWNSEVARRRPDLVVQEIDSLDRMCVRYLELAGSPLGAVAHVQTDRARVLRHLIDEVAQEPPAVSNAVDEAGQQLATQVGPHGAWTEPQAERLASLIRSHAGARPEIMATGDGTIVVNFGPRRGNGAYVLDAEGRSHWVNPARYAA
jgi:hypothetical protein